MTASTFDDQVTDTQLANYAKLIYKITGIHVSPQKKTLLSNRIRRRLRATGIKSFEAYYKRLRVLPVDDPEWDGFLQEITTHETYLFRDEGHWAWFRGSYLPEVASQASSGEREKSLRIWSAACSTGDEAYTIACCIADRLENHLQWKIDILGTDIGVDGAIKRIARTFEVRGLTENVTQYDNATVGSGSVVNDVEQAYNDSALLATEYQAHGAAVNTSTSPKVQYGYDASVDTGELTKGLRPTKVTYPNGRIAHLTYGSAGSNGDNLNRLDAINDDNGGSAGTAVAQYSYLGGGDIVKFDYTEPDVRLDHDHGTANAYAGFDKFGRVVDHRWYDYGASTEVDRFKYGYDRVGNRTYREHVVAAANSKDLDEFYTYDGVNRLKTMDRGNLTGSPPTGITGTPAKEQDWTLDAMGNWTDFIEKAVGSTDLDQDRTHNKVNEITGITEQGGDPVWIHPAYDVAGNMTEGPQPGAETVKHKYTYDAWNRLVKVTDASDDEIATMEYDGLNRRIEKGEYSPAGTLDKTRHFYYSNRWQVLEERIDSATIAER